MNQEPQIFRFGPLKCKWAFNFRVKLDFCQRSCKLLGAAVCPRALSLPEMKKSSQGMTTSNITSEISEHG